MNGQEIEGSVPLTLHKGDLITLELPGGGGFGVAEDRDPELVAADLADGRVGELRF